MKNRGDYFTLSQMEKAFQSIKEKAKNTKGDKFDYKKFKTSVWKQEKENLQN